MRVASFEPGTPLTRVSAIECDVETASDGCKDNSRLFLPPTSFCLITGHFFKMKRTQPCIRGWAIVSNNDNNENTAMLITTTENVVGYRVLEMKGQVFGVVVRSRGLAGNLMASLRSIVGGEITEYTALLEETRRHAIDRMVKNAQLMGGNAVVMMRFDSSEIGQTMSEIVAYGTVVVIEKT